MKSFLPVTAFVIVSFLLNAAALALPNTVSYAYAKYTSSKDVTNTCNYNCSTSAYTLGKDTVTIDGVFPVSAGPVTNFYNSGPVTIGTDRTHDGTFAEAKSGMTSEGDKFDCYYNYNMFTSAKVSLDGVSGLFSGPAAFATAQAKDPQVFAFPGGVAAIDYGLDSGSALLAVRPGKDFAHMLFTIDVPFIPGELASIDLSNDGTGTHVVVTLSSEPGVSFFNPATHLPITAADITLAILARPDLATEGGLISPLSLFGVAFDLFGRPITFGDGLQSNLNSEVSSAAGVPEPTSAAILLSAIGLTALRRRWHSSPAKRRSMCCGRHSPAVP